MKRSVVVLACICAAAGFAANDDFWNQKPYANWSAKECARLLKDSPWAKTIKLQRTNLREISRETGRERTQRGPAPGAPPGTSASDSIVAPGTQGLAAADQGTGNANQEISYTAQIRSAAPVRQAFVRMKQIESKYDALGGAAKSRADQAYQNYLGQQFPEKIVVLVTYGANLADNDRVLAHYWQSQTLDTLKNSVFLSGPDGDRMGPIAYVGGSGAQREFQFVFPRNPATAQAAADKPLVFEFDHPASAAMAATLELNQPGVGNEPKQRLYFKFPVKEMMMAGKTMY